MTVDQTLSWATGSIIVNVYVFLILSRRWPQVKFRLYLLNLSGLFLCGYALALTSPNKTWMGIYILNLAFQNGILAGDRSKFKV